MIHLDTHAVVWLYAGETGRFPSVALEAIDQEQIAVSPIVALELQYLREIDRISVEAPLMLESLMASIGLQIASASFFMTISESLPESWTRDPFDRIIVAQAKAEQARLLTKDKTILDHYRDAFWDQA